LIRKKRPAFYLIAAQAQALLRLRTHVVRPPHVRVRGECFIFDVCGESMGISLSDLLCGGGIFSDACDEINMWNHS